MTAIPAPQDLRTATNGPKSTDDSGEGVNPALRTARRYPTTTTKVTTTSGAVYLITGTTITRQGLPDRPLSFDGQVLSGRVVYGPEIGRPMVIWVDLPGPRTADLDTTPVVSIEVVE